MCRVTLANMKMFPIQQILRYSDMSEFCLRLAFVHHVLKDFLEAFGVG